MPNRAAGARGRWLWEWGAQLVLALRIPNRALGFAPFRSRVDPGVFAFLVLLLEWSC